MPTGLSVQFACFLMLTCGPARSSALSETLLRAFKSICIEQDLKPELVSKKVSELGWKKLETFAVISKPSENSQRWAGAFDSVQMVLGTSNLSRQYNCSLVISASIYQEIKDDLKKSYDVKFINEMTSPDYKIYSVSINIKDKPIEVVVTTGKNRSGLSSQSYMTAGN